MLKMPAINIFLNPNVLFMKIDCFVGKFQIKLMVNKHDTPSL